MNKITDADMQYVVKRRGKLVVLCPATRRVLKERIRHRSRSIQDRETIKIEATEVTP